MVPGVRNGQESRSLESQLKSQISEILESQLKSPYIYYVVATKLVSHYQYSVSMHQDGGVRASSVLTTTIQAQ